MYELMNALCITRVIICYLDNANGFPGEVEAGVEEEGEEEGKSFVPAEWKHKREALRTQH